MGDWKEGGKLATDLLDPSECELRWRSDVQAGQTWSDCSRKWRDTDWESQGR